MDVRLSLEGEAGQIAVDALHDALGDVLELLREAADAGRVEKQLWRVDGLEVSSAHVVMTAPEGAVIAAIVSRGLDDLRQVAAIPDGWTRHMVKRVRDLGRRSGSGGTTSISLTLGSVNAKARVLDGVIVDHADRALGSETATYGSMRGRVDRWNEHGKREIGVTRDDGGSLPATYRAELSARILSEALGHRIEAWGLIRRNIVGQVIGMTIENFTVMNDRDATPIASLAGVYQSPEDDRLTLDEWLEQRHAD